MVEAIIFKTCTISRNDQTIELTMPSSLAEFYVQYPYALIVFCLLLGVFLIRLILLKQQKTVALKQIEEQQQKLTTEFALLQQQLKHDSDAKIKLESDLISLTKTQEQLNAEHNHLQIKNTETSQQLLAVKNNLSQSEHVVKEAQDLLASLRNSKSQLVTELASLKVAFEKEKQHSDEKLEQLEKNRTLLKQEFESLANEILKTSQQDFKEKGLADMDLFLKPFKQQVGDFKAKVEEIHTQDLKQRAELKAELNNLQELNKDITLKAEELTTALKGQKKTQGNWGELILENVLDRSGLIDGKDFKRQQNFTTEEGRQLPDVVVYLPDDKHLVIDAKVSLNAYTRFVNSDDETVRQVAIKEHVAAVSARIKELSDKNYFDLPGLNSPDMVFMFIPIESAFVEAVKADDSLFQQAIDQKILIATPTTLLTSLNIVRQLWRFEDQNKHSAKLADSASKIYNKLSNILQGLDKLGVQLDKSKDVWADTMKQFVHGRGNLVKQVKDFEKLGVAVQKELPQKLVEQSDLEIE